MQDPSQGTRQELESIWWAGVRAVNGYCATRAALADAAGGTPDRIIAVGKAASAMTRAARDAFPGSIPTLLVTKHGYAERGLDTYETIRCIESSHPVPDADSLRAGEELLTFASATGPQDWLVMLVSGGASALAESLVPGKNLDDLQKLNVALLSQSVDIAAINRQRRQISMIKGGGLLARVRCAKITVLAISDVRGDDIHVIGSGIGDPGRSATGNVETRIIASNALAREEAGKHARKLGKHVVVNAECLYGDCIEVADRIAKMVMDGSPGLYILGGEPTVKLPPNPGRGGRNQALAVELARRFWATEGIYALCAGTDGADGTGPAAGGFVDWQSWERTPFGSDALAAADTGSWLERAQALFMTGPTGTNVMDLCIIEKKSPAVPNINR